MSLLVCFGVFLVLAVSLFLTCLGADFFCPELQSLFKTWGMACFLSLHIPACVGSRWFATLWESLACQPLWSVLCDVTWSAWKMQVCWRAWAQTWPSIQSVKVREVSYHDNIAQRDTCTGCERKSLRPMGCGPVVFVEKMCSKGWKLRSWW